MADIARRVTELNRFPQIKVINKHSTDMKVGEDIEVCLFFLYFSRYLISSNKTDVEIVLKYNKIRPR